MKSKKRRGVVVYTGGVYDILHVGHIKILNKAKALGDYLIVGIQSDEEVANFKGTTILNTRERVKQMKALGIADEVVVYRSGTTPDILVKTKPNVFVHGNDWKTQMDRSGVISYMKKNNINLVLFPRTKEITTSEIINRIIEKRSILKKRHLT